MFDRSCAGDQQDVDGIKPVEPQISKVVMNAIDQFSTRESMNPGLRKENNGNGKYRDLSTALLTIKL